MVASIAADFAHSIVLPKAPSTSFGLHGDFEHRSVAAGFLGLLDVSRYAAAERENLGAEVQIDDGFHRFLVLPRHGRHAGLDAIDAQLGELLGNGDLVFDGKDDAGRLLALAQRHVVNLDLAIDFEILGRFGIEIPRTDIPLIGQIRCRGHENSMLKRGLYDTGWNAHPVKG